MKHVFPAGRLASPEDVVDGEDFIDAVVERLLMGSYVTLAGARRIGKSGVAGAVMGRLQARGAYTAYLDVFRTSSVSELAARLLQAIIANRTGVLDRTARDLQDLRRLLGEPRITATIRDLELGLSLFERPEPDPYELLERALATAEKIAERGNRRMVLVLDEFQDVAKFGGEDLLKRMRAALQFHPRTVGLFLGSQADLMATVFGNSRAAFFRCAVPMKLPPIPWSEWEA